MKALRYISILCMLLVAVNFNACQDDDIQTDPPVAPDTTGGTVSKETEINVAMDRYLKEMYLWNDEYKTLKLDFTKTYNLFLSDALLSMKTNTLDKRRKGNGEAGYHLFSFIERVPSISSSRSGTKLLKKELKYSFGIDGISVVIFTDISSIRFYIQSVQPGSPADAAGLKRGTAITHIDGQKIVESTYVEHYKSLMEPGSASTRHITDSESHQLSITAKAMSLNPVIFKQTQEVKGRQIGYLVYSEFDAAFDEELFDAFKYFKSRNVTDLILDLRYNGGGHTMSANLISSCIAGSSVTNKVFSAMRYNADRMKKRNNEREKEYFMYSNYPNLGTSLAAGDLGLNRVYCLVGAGTASSSELVINALRGIDVDVILIGEKTTGKNVGMEPTYITAGADKYRFLPITFQSYNAKGFGDYEAGFIPNQRIDEAGANGYSLIAYGANNEPLYAAAVNDIITGAAPLKSRSLPYQQPIEGAVRKMAVPALPGSGGMIKLPIE